MVRVIYSPDDDDGYYLEDENWRTSDIYNTAEEALADLREGKVNWHDPD